MRWPLRLVFLLLLHHEGRHHGNATALILHPVVSLSAREADHCDIAPLSFSAQRNETGRILCLGLGIMVWAWRFALIITPITGKTIVRHNKLARAPARSDLERTCAGTLASSGSRGVILVTLSTGAELPRSDDWAGCSHSV